MPWSTDSNIRHVCMQVQQEDIALCEAVQRGLRSPAYDSGR